MRVLHLTLKKKWFQMILSGEKKQEYREIKAYWAQRLISHLSYASVNGCVEPQQIQHYYPFDVVRFKNGYSKNAPEMDVACLGISMDTGKWEWGAAPDTYYFVIELGDILSQKNCC